MSSGIGYSSAAVEALLDSDNDCALGPAGFCLQPMTGSSKLVKIARYDEVAHQHLLAVIET
jgi:hypothetical protein